MTAAHPHPHRRWPARILVALARRAVDAPRTVLLIAAVLIVASLASAALRLELRTSNLDLVSPDLPAVAAFRAFAHEFGSPNVLVVAFEGRDRAALRAAVDELAPRLAALPSVRGVLGHLAVPPDLAPLLAHSTYLEASDGRMAFLLVQPRDAEAQAATIEPWIREVRAVLAAAALPERGIGWGLTGLPQYALDDRDVIAHDASRMSLLSLLLVAVLFVGAYASIWRPLLATLTLLVAAVVTLGFVAWVPGHLTLLSAFAASILFGMGDDFGVHLVNLVEAAAAGSGGAPGRGADAGSAVGSAASLATAPEHRGHERAAVLAAVDALADSLSTGGLTTVAAFLALCASGFRGFAELGLIAAVGILCALVAVVTVLPALLVSVRIPPGRGRALGDRDVGPWFVRLARPLVAWPLVALAVGGPLWLGLPGFDGDYLNLEPRDSEAVRLEREMVRRSELSPQFAVFVVDSRRAVLEVSMALRAEPTVGEVHSISEIDQLARLLAADDDEVGDEEGNESDEGEDRDHDERAADGIRELDERPASGELAELAAPFASASGRFAVYAYPRGDIWDPATRDAFLDAMARLDSEGRRGLTTTSSGTPAPHAADRTAAGGLTGMPVLGRFMIDLSLAAMRRASILAALVVVLLVALDLGRFGRTVVALVPMVLGGGLLLVAMRALGIAWNPLDVMALPVVIGYGVDNGVHLVHRFVAERGDLARTLAGAGRGVLLSTVTTLAGFAPLAFTAHQGFASFARVLSLGVAASLVASLLVLPWLLGVTRRSLLAGS